MVQPVWQGYDCVACGENDASNTSDSNIVQTVPKPGITHFHEAGDLDDDLLTGLHNKSFNTPKTFIKSRIQQRRSRADLLATLDGSCRTAGVGHASLSR